MAAEGERAQEMVVAAPAVAARAAAWVVTLVWVMEAVGEAVVGRVEEVTVAAGMEAAGTAAVEMAVAVVAEAMVAAARVAVEMVAAEQVVEMEEEGMAAAD